MIENPLLRGVMIANPMTAPMETFRYIFFGSGQVTGVMWAASLAWTAVLLVLDKVIIHTTLKMNVKN